MKLTKTNKILIGAGLLIAGLWWWNKTKKEKKSGANGLEAETVFRGTKAPSSAKYTPNSWFKDKNGKYHWVDARGHLST